MAKDFPDLTGDGQVTRADVLKGRGVFRYGGRVKKMAEGGSPDVEADLQALKTLKQPDYDVGGPKRRYPAGKVKRYPEEDEYREFKIPKRVLRGLGKKMAKGGSVSSASKRADGCAVKGKTKGRFV